MANSLQKACLGIISLGVSFISISLVPVSKQAMYWNRCIDSTVEWINEAPGLQGWNSKAKESLAVGVCNGAVYEPKLKTN